MSDKFWEYVKKNWDGWPLHSLIAAGTMTPWVTNLLNIYPGAMLGANILFWPIREMWQHDDKLGIRVGFWRIWTVHRILEWACPMVAAAISYWWWVL